MREFIQEFEHSTHRMYQLLYETLEDSDNDEAVREIMGLLNWAYRFSTYALVSAWIDDKQEGNTLMTSIDLTTDEVRQEGALTKMQVPREYKHTAKRLR